MAEERPADVLLFFAGCSGALTLAFAVLAGLTGRFLVIAAAMLVVTAIFGGLYALEVRRRRTR